MTKVIHRPAALNRIFTGSVRGLIRNSASPILRCAATQAGLAPEKLRSRCVQYYPAGNYLGLLPTLLRWLEHPEERQLVWSRTAVRPHRRVKLPLLMCPDNLDLSCVVIAAEVIVGADMVRWPRMGWDATRSPDPADYCRDVEWLPLIPALTFARHEYQRCLDAFTAALRD